MMRFTVFQLRLHVAVEKCFGLKNKCPFICSVLLMYLCVIFAVRNGFQVSAVRIVIT